MGNGGASKQAEMMVAYGICGRPSALLAGLSRPFWRPKSEDAGLRRSPSVPARGPRAAVKPTVARFSSRCFSAPPGRRPAGVLQSRVPLWRSHPASIALPPVLAGVAPPYGPLLLESAAASALNQACPSLLVVTATSDDGAGSLREAINCANARPGTDSISFSIPGPGPHYSPRIGAADNYRSGGY